MAEPNTFLVQLRGPFTPEDNLLEMIELEKNFYIYDTTTGTSKPDTPENRFIKKIGIQITPEASLEAQVLMSKAIHQIQIGKSDDDIFTIGETGILEMDNLRLDKNELLKFHFLQNENELTIVDLVLETNIINSKGGK